MHRTCMGLNVGSVLRGNSAGVACAGATRLRPNGHASHLASKGVGHSPGKWVQMHRVHVRQCVMMRMYTCIALRNNQLPIGGRDCHRYTGDLVFPQGCSAGGRRVRKQKSGQHEQMGSARRLRGWGCLNESIGLVARCTSRQHNGDRDHHECSRMQQPPTWCRLWSPSVLHNAQSCQQRKERDHHERVVSGFRGVSTVHARSSPGGGGSSSSRGCQCGSATRSL